MKPFIKLNLIPILFFLCLHLELNAQVSISGTVLSNENIVPGATLKLTSAGQDSTVLKTTVSDKKGHFVFQNIKEGNYTLHVTAIGYQPFFTLVKAVAKQASPLTIQLTSGNIAIEEVVINPPSTILMKGDTLEYDTKNFQTRDFADADEVVSQIPGVMIDEDGNVTAHGEPVTRIIVDGKEFFSTDPKIALKTLPADNYRPKSS
ncbi:carboxypeptidase-like regulatory domain-containing protein [Sphingobacterium sp. T2]|uniref:carboxypeptidase-like regulatory domain-containing protein n=1 Tax=Sphingobacterium sp. T2 TaxID=1590596 RepID=UPI00068BC04D|nr:carboxypeptidase-like regulatory domain-containing protein [Sphingobacterium sp. T2]